MGKTLVALYRDKETARSVVDALLEAGFSGDDISLLVNNREAHGGNAREISTGECIGLGAVIGAMVGIGSAFVPGIGLVIGMGSLAVVVTAGIGALAGALTGGVTASLIDIDADAREAQLYGGNQRWQGALVSLTTNSQWMEWAEKIMTRHAPTRIEEREANGPNHWGAAFYNEPNDSSQMLKLLEKSSTRIKQLGNTATIRRPTRVYEYRN